jgi:predicted ATPase/DNA-binding winged helix-turn-helix (wHTH) protein
LGTGAIAVSPRGEEGDGDMARETFVFGPFQLVPAQQLLTKNGQPLALGARALAILALLAARAPEVVSNAEIKRQVWPGIFVEEANIRVHVSGLRKVLGEGHGLVNHPGEGYALVAEVQRIAQDVGASMPGPRTLLLGREEAIAQLSESLVRNRLTTLIGPGGIGKTSLAIVTAQQAAGAFPDGVHFIDFSPLQDASLVASRVALALGTRLSDPDSVAELAAELRGRSLLLVLDNCEHVVDSAAILTEALQAGAPELSILATSREPLRAEGEHLYRMQPLGLPPASLVEQDPAAAMRFPAVRLLIERAAGNDPPYLVTEGEAPFAAQLCRALGGVPLAIELAAARLGSLNLEELIVNLEEALSTPLDRPGVPARQRTLRETLDWSYGLLLPPERALLDRLGIFCGFFSLEGVVAVVADRDEEAVGWPRLSAPAALAALAELIDKSLVVADLSGDQPWYRMLDTVRHYARGKLVNDRLTVVLSRRHAIRVLARLGEMTSPSSVLPEQRQAANRLLLDDVRGALEWAFSPSGDTGTGASLAAAAGPFYLQISMAEEFRRQAARALAAINAAPEPDRTAELSLLLTLGSAIYNTDGSSDLVFDAYSRALTLAKELGDIASERRSLWGLWLHAFGMGHYAESLTYAHAYRACTAPEDDPLHIRDRIPALSLQHMGNLQPARDYVERALSRSSPQGGNVLGGYQYEHRVAALCILARVLWLQGLADQARAAARESLEEGLRSGHALSLCFSLNRGQCFVSLACGELEVARESADLLLATARENTLPYWLRFGHVYRRRVAVALEEPLGDGQAFLLCKPWNNGHVELIATLGLGYANPKGFAAFEQGQVFWGLPEVLRLEAERLVEQDRTRAAALLQRAEDIAAQQGALAWQLRIAMTRMRLEFGSARALRALEETFSQYTEGFDSADLVAAQQLVSGR